MTDFNRLKTTLAYARLGLISLSAAIVPITATAQELCGVDLFEGEPDADNLLRETLNFLDVLENNGVVAFDGQEGRMSIGSARQALSEGVGSASLLACVVNSSSIEFALGNQNQVIGCDTGGAPSLFQSGGSNPAVTGGQLFCTTEIVTISRFLGSEA